MVLWARILPWKRRFCPAPAYISVDVPDHEIISRPGHCQSAWVMAQEDRLHFNSEYTDAFLLVLHHFFNHPKGHAIQWEIILYFHSENGLYTGPIYLIGNTKGHISSKVDLKVAFAHCRWPFLDMLMALSVCCKKICFVVHLVVLSASWVVIIKEWTVTSDV